MHNDPELNPKQLGSITGDFIQISELLKDAAYQIRARKISAHPIFVLCKETQPVGQLLIGKEDRADLKWNYYVSLLGEFIERGLVDFEMEEDFIAAYKNPDEFACLFVLDPAFMQFVFIPYPEE